MTVRIYLLGRPGIETKQQVLGPETFPGRQGRVVFACLAWQPAQVGRDRLGEVLWPDRLPDAWESSLAAIISKLRRLLARAGLPAVLDSADGAYELRLPQGTWVDVRAAINALDRAEGLLRRGATGEAWSEATVASAIFRRPFLPGEELPWAEDRRRELAELELRTLDCLCEIWLRRRDPALAAQCARRLIELAPFRESAYARLMEAHLAAGNRAEALRVYGELRGLLREEMGIDPSGRIEMLYEEALGQEPAVGERP